MGDFFGHALPGSMFIFFGLWMSIQYPIHYFQHRKRGIKTIFKAKVVYPFPFFKRKCSRIPVEAIVKLVLTVVGMVIELGAALVGSHGTLVGHYFQLQHFSMYMAFCSSAVVDILIHFGIRLPKYTDYVFLSLALATEGTLFKFHAHGQNNLEITLHSILFLIITGNAIILLIESMLPTIVLVSIIRPAIVLLHGLWFWQIAFVRYPPRSGKAWEDNHESVEFVVAIFTWLSMATLCFSLTAFCVVGVIVNGKCNKTSFGSQEESEKGEYNLLLTNETDEL